MNQPQHTELLGLSYQQLSELIETCGQAPYRARQLLDGLYRQRWWALDQFTVLPLALRQQLIHAGYSVGSPRIEKRFASTTGPFRYRLRSRTARAWRLCGCRKGMAARLATALTSEM